MSAAWAAVTAAVVLVATSLDLTAVLIRAASRATPAARRRLLQGAGVARLVLVAAAWFVSIALVELPLLLVAVLGIVPLAFGFAAQRRHGRPSHFAVTGWMSAAFTSLATGGDDVAAWLVVIRWQVGHQAWPVAVVLVTGAIGAPWVAGVISRRRSAERVATTLGAVAPIAQIAVGIALIAGSVVIAT
jgi:hypothetical protein